MILLVSYVCFLISESSCIPIDTTEIVEVETVKSVTEEDTPQTNENKNPIQQWFENLSKDTSTNAQNAFNTVKDWFSQFTPNNSIGGGTSNLPVMYMGSFQLLKMPMPQIGDIFKGIGDLATAAQTVNKLTGGGLPISLPIPGLQDKKP